MSLRERLRRLQPAIDAAVEHPEGGPEAAAPRPSPYPLPVEASAAPAAPVEPEGRGTGSMYISQEEPELSAVDQLKLDLHRRLIERLNLEALERITDERELTAQIREAVGTFLREESTPLAQSEREEIVEQIVYEITGLGPLEPFFRDPTITDILVNSARHIYVEKGGRLQRVNAAFRNDAHVLTVIDRIVSRVGRRVDESSPMVDARLPDGSRVNAIIPPLALDGPVLSIRRFGAELAMDQLIARGAITRRMATLLAGCVHARLNVLISGGTGSGKTTLLNALSSFIPVQERIITIEDAAELQLQQEHVVRLETRPPNVEGRGEVIARDLVRNALRMRPNRIIIGEVRGAEAVDMLQAMNTGHEGSMATIHANTPRDALSRLENMVLLAGSTLPMRALREQIASTIHLIVQVARLSDGTRRVTSITEILGLEGDIITTNELYTFRRRGMANGRVVGRFEATGIRPTFTDRVEVTGIPLPADLFDENVFEEIPEPGAPVVPLAVPTPEVPGASPNGNGAPAAPADDTAWKLVRQLEGSVRSLRSSVDAERRRADEARRELEEVRRALAAATTTSSRAADAAVPAPAAGPASVAAAPASPESAAPARDHALELAVLAFLEGIEEIVEGAASRGDARLRQRAARLEKRTGALLARLGLEEIPGAGAVPEPGVHDVVRTVPAAAAEQAGKVAEVLARGYRRNGEVLRRAQVAVYG